MTTLPALFDADLLALIRATNGAEPCATSDPDWWQPADSTTIGGYDSSDQTRAKQLCYGCHLLDACRDYALTHENETGVWGATGDKDRAAIARADYLARNAS